MADGDDPRLGAKPANVDDGDWKQLQSAFSSVTSPGFGIRPQDDNPVLGNGANHPTLAPLLLRPYPR